MSEKSERVREFAEKNAALPDGHPGKLSREHVEQIRDEVMQSVEAGEEDVVDLEGLLDLANAIELILPEEE